MPISTATVPGKPDFDGLDARHRHADILCRAHNRIIGGHIIDTSFLTRQQEIARRW